MRPPSAYFGGDEWGDKDHLLVLAHTIYEDGLNEMGLPRHLTTHPDNDGWYQVASVIDHSVAAREQWEKDNPTHTPGERVYVQYTRPADKPLRALSPEPEAGEDD